MGETRRQQGSLRSAHPGQLSAPSPGRRAPGRITSHSSRRQSYNLLLLQAQGKTAQSPPKKYRGSHLIQQHSAHNPYHRTNDTDSPSHTQTKISGLEASEQSASPRPLPPSPQRSGAGPPVGKQPGAPEPVHSLVLATARDPGCAHPASPGGTRRRAEGRLPVISPVFPAPLSPVMRMHWSLS